MKGPSSRIERIESGLSGREMAIAEIRADLAHPTMAASSRWRMERMFTETPLCDRIGEVIEKAHDGKDRGAMWRRIKAHQRDAMFLMHLWTACNTRVLDNEGETREMINHLATLNALILEAGRRKGKEKEHMDMWIRKGHRMATQVVYRMYHTHFALGWLSQNYFNGEELLFADLRMAHRRLLAAAVKTVRFMNRMIEIAGEEFVEPPKYELPFRTFDIQGAKRGAKATLRPVVKLMIDKVTAEVHAALDEDREAAAIYSQLNGV